MVQRCPFCPHVYKSSVLTTRQCAHARLFLRKARLATVWLMGNRKIKFQSYTQYREGLVSRLENETTTSTVI